MSIHVSFAKPSERNDILAWVHSQAGHENYEFLNWSEILVVRDSDGNIRAVSEMAAIQTAEFVFDVSRKAHETWKTWRAIIEYYKAKQLDPIIIAPTNSKLSKYVSRILKRAFIGFRFFVVKK